MSSVQDSREAVKNMTRRAIRTSSYIMWPLMIGLAVVAKPLVIVLLTDKWIMAVPFLQVACISWGLEPLQTANLNAIKSVGRSDIFFRLEIIKKTIAVGILLVSMRYGVLAIAVSGACYSFIASMINASPNRKLLNYSYIDQIKDILPSVLLSLVMAALIYPVSFVVRNSYLLLMMQVVLGGAIYIAGSWMIKFEPFFYCLDILKPMADKVLKRSAANEA
jgi:O-antigen/teichoic acid export membrane protein